MDYNAINSALALFENAVLNNKVDRLIIREFLLNMIPCKMKPNEVEINIAQLEENIIQALKADELKAVIKANEFQGLYNITHVLPPALHGGVKEFFKLYPLNELWQINAWKNFIGLDFVQQIGKSVEILSIAEGLLLEYLIARNLPQDFSRYCQVELILKKPQKPAFPQLARLKDEFEYQTIIDLKICDKSFQFDLLQFSAEKIRAHLKKYLIADNYKNKIIYDTVRLAKELVNPSFIAQNESWYILYCLTSLHDYIFEKESALFNYIFEQRKQNGWIYQSFIKENTLLYLAPEELFLFCISAGSKVSEIRNFYNSNYSAIWHNYVNAVSAEKSLYAATGLASRLREKLAQSLFASANTDISVNPVIPKPKKEKLPCDNYLYAALLYEKSLKTDVEFLPLCREASKKYYSKKGKEFSGEQLANVFYQELKKFDSFAEFCKPEYNGDRIKKLQKEINWSQS